MSANKYITVLRLFRDYPQISNFQKCPKTMYVVLSPLAAILIMTLVRWEQRRKSWSHYYRAIKYAQGGDQGG